MPKGIDAFVLDSNIDTDDSEHCDGKICQFEQIDDENELRDIDIRKLGDVKRIAADFIIDTIGIS
jgi:hypothetical protein